MAHDIVDDRITWCRVEIGGKLAWIRFAIGESLGPKTTTITRPEHLFVLCDLLEFLTLALSQRRAERHIGKAANVPIRFKKVANERGNMNHCISIKLRRIIISS
jgi:hypothetical protein